MAIRDLKERIAALPEQPGVYLYLDPAGETLYAFAEPLAKISPHFVADPRANGGSLFRIYRDTRFSPDKTPYKPNVGAHFRHVAGKDAHAPGFYLHLDTESCFAGCGIWGPGGDALAKIRNAIADNPKEWKRVTGAAGFRETFDITGIAEGLAPRGEVRVRAAAVGGPLAALKDGDIITLDIEARVMNVDLSDEEIRVRLRNRKPPAERSRTGVLAKYARTVSSPSDGAVTFPLD